MPSENSSRPVLPENWETAGFGLYIHWPFCQAKCPYCDFNSHVATSITEDDWRAAYLSEIVRVGTLTPGRRLTSIYFGGGTPSLMSPDLVADVLSATKAQWDWANDIEITLEANPTSTEAGKLQGFKSAGVNRVSLGLQALNDADLRKLGRMHSAAEGIAAMETARTVFDRVNFDLIYARQDQSRKAWREELTKALSFQPSHLSLYQLTIEPGTVFGDRHARNLLPGLPEDDDAADMYFDTQELCAAQGLAAYEVSNHAKPGYESAHNLIYWRGGDVLGIGPGAHGRYTSAQGRIATETHLSPQTWLAAVRDQGTGETLHNVQVDEDLAGEYLMMSLRLSEGSDLQKYRTLGGADLGSERLDHLAQLGLIQIEDGQLKTTDKGRPILNALLRELLVT